MGSSNQSVWKAPPRPARRAARVSRRHALVNPPITLLVRVSKSSGHVSACTPPWHSTCSTGRGVGRWPWHPRLTGQAGPNVRAAVANTGRIVPKSFGRGVGDWRLRGLRYSAGDASRPGPVVAARFAGCRVGGQPASPFAPRLAGSRSAPGRAAESRRGLVRPVDVGAVASNRASPAHWSGGSAASQASSVNRSAVLAKGVASRRLQRQAGPRRSPASAVATSGRRCRSRPAHRMAPDGIPKSTGPGKWGPPPSVMSRHPDRSHSDPVTASPVEIVGSADRTSPFAPPSLMVAVRSRAGGSESSGVGPAGASGRHQ